MAAMMATLASDVVSERHHFTDINPNIPLSKKTKLEAHYFEADKTLQSLPFENVANYEVASGFYSPKSENNHAHGRLNGDNTKVILFCLIAFLASLLVQTVYGVPCTNGGRAVDARLH